jgi:uncharacterized protein
MTVRIDLATARRFLAIRHLLAPPRSLPGSAESVLAVVGRLGSLQFDPLEVAGRNHDLVLHARVSGYSRALADELLYGRRLLFEAYNKSLNLLPTRELPWYRISWDRAAAAGGSGRMIEDQAPLAAKILAEIEAGGPRASIDFEREAAIDWWWGPTSAARAVLEALNTVGRLGLARREGNRRYFDLVERLYPADLLETRIPEREQQRHKLLSRYRGHGLLGSGGSGELWLGIGDTRRAELRTELRRELIDRGELVAVTVEGLKGERFVIADELPMLAQAEREVAAVVASAGAPARLPAPVGDAPPGCAFVAPLDPLMWDRALLGPLYGFDYVWEVYTPAAKRRWGYYVLPILFGDRLVGRIEPRIDRRAKEVRILSLGWEDGFDPLAEPGFTAAFGVALQAYLGFAGAKVIVAPAGRGHPSLFRVLGKLVAVRRPDPARPTVPATGIATGRLAAAVGR